jgi:hypothetical protein
MKQILTKVEETFESERDSSLNPPASCLWHSIHFASQSSPTKRRSSTILGYTDG